MIPPANVRNPVNLIARLPTIMKKYDEIIKITDSQNPEFDFVWAIAEWMRRQLYIITAEEYGLRRYERLLGITPMDGESFLSRRNHVLVRWNQTSPYTFRFLIGLLEVLTDGNFEVIPNFHFYEMEIRVFTLDFGIVSDLAFILKNIIPANIYLTSSNHIRFAMTGAINIGGMMHTTKNFTVTQDFKAEITAQVGKISTGAAIRQTKQVVISDAFNAGISSGAKVAAAGSVMKVIKYVITEGV